MEQIVEEALSGFGPEERLRTIEAVRAVLDRELFNSSMDVPNMACPACRCTECVRYGTTRTGTPR